jgi:TetR/AcrR family transcriptional repressor of mexJK operon
MSMSELPHTAAQDSDRPSGSDSEVPCARAAGRPREADIDARMQDLLESAGTLFLEKGYSKVSLGMIAREAHVAVRTIYVKFGGKAGLFNAVIANGRSRYFNIGDMDSDTRPIEQILGDFGLRLLQMMSMPRIVRMHRMVIAEASTNPELAITFDRAGPGQILELLSRFFAHPAQQARFRTDVRPERLAVHLFNCILGDQVTRLMFEPLKDVSDADIRAKVAEGLDFFFKTALRVGQDHSTT